MKTVVAVYKEPGQEPKVKEIFDTLEAYQNLVGGYIEHVTIEPGIGMIINEEGKLHNMAPNFALGADMILGPAVFVGEDGDEFVSLTEKQVELVTKRFRDSLFID